LFSREGGRHEIRAVSHGEVQMRNEDPRVARSRRAILAAAVSLLQEAGFNGATIEAIAARSGAAKTTIYRHWPQKRDLLLAAVESVVPKAEASDRGSLGDDLQGFVRELTTALNTPPLSGIIPAMIEAAERFPDVARILAAFTAQRREPVIRAVERAAARGEIRDDCEPEMVASMLLGPLFYRRLLSRQKVTVEFGDEVVAAVLRAVSSGT
jgi:AcrR family transcriptional regulator